jgi:hypothetical protein
MLNEFSSSITIFALVLMVLVLIGATVEGVRLAFAPRSRSWSRRHGRPGPCSCGVRGGGRWRSLPTRTISASRRTLR